MPNWVQNVVNMEGIGDSVWIVKGENGRKTIDFETLIPMPEELRTVEAGTVESESVVLAVAKLNSVMCAEKPWGFFDPISISIPKSLETSVCDKVKAWDKDPDELVQTGLKYISNALKYGHLDWYSWANEKWGTKWNIKDSEEIMIEPDSVLFWTAWGAPLPVVEKLSAQYPKREITIMWADEGALHSGCAVYKNGKKIKGGYDKTEKAIHDRCEEVWGEDFWLGEDEEEED